MEQTRAKTVSAYHPLKYLAAAFFVGAFLWAVQSSGGYDADITPIALAVFGVAAMLTFVPVAESYTVAAVQDGASRWDRVMANVVFAILIMVPTRLVDWTGAESLLKHVVWILIGVVVIVPVFQLIRPASPTPRERDLFLDDREFSRRLIWFLRIWPLIYVAIWIILALFPPEGGRSEVQQLVYLLLFPAICLRLRPRPGLGMANPQWIQAIGLALLAFVALIPSV